MKKLLVFLGVGLFGLQCTKTETITALTLPCDCKDYLMIYEYKGVKGTIYFPRKPTEPYVVFARALFNGEIQPYFGICSDSVSTTLIKLNKITDSTEVIFNGGSVIGDENNSDNACGHRLALRITSLRKAP